MQGVEMGEEISHRLWFHLETRHRWSLSTDDLMDQGWITEAGAHIGQFGTQQSLTSDPVTSCAVHANQLSAVLAGALEIQCGLHVWIDLGFADHPDQKNHAGHGGDNHQGGNQGATAAW